MERCSSGWRSSTTASSCRTTLAESRWKTANWCSRRNSFCTPVGPALSQPPNGGFPGFVSKPCPYFTVVPYGTLCKSHGRSHWNGRPKSFRLGWQSILRCHPRIPPPRIFHRPLLRFVIHVHESEPLAEALLPFKVIDQTPVMVDAHLSAVADRRCQ